MSGKTWRNRIVGHAEVAPDQLLASPLNFRIHTRYQQEAMTGALSEVGWVDEVIVNTQTGHIVNGHLRVTLALRHDAPTVPVKYVDLSPEEERLVLATFDPISALAEFDREKFGELLEDTGTAEPALQELLAKLAEEQGIVPPDEADWADAFEALPDGEKAPFQQMTFTVSDRQAETIQQAMAAAKGAGPFGDTGNENSNGNALARICEAYLG